MIDVKRLSRSLGGGVETYDYLFEVPIRYEYRLTFTIFARGRFRKVFESVRKQWQEKHGVDIGELDKEELDVPEKVFKLLKVMVRPMFKDRKIALSRREKLPVILLDYTVDSAIFKRVGNDWNLIIVLRGAFDDKK